MEDPIVYEEKTEAMLAGEKLRAENARCPLCGGIGVSFCESEDSCPSNYHTPGWDY